MRDPFFTHLNSRYKSLLISKFAFLAAAIILLLFYMQMPAPTRLSHRSLFHFAMASAILSSILGLTRAALIHRDRSRALNHYRQNRCTACHCLLRGAATHCPTCNSPIPAPHL